MKGVIEVVCLVVSMVVSMVDERADWWAMKEADVKGTTTEMNWVVPWDAEGRLSVGVMVSVTGNDLGHKRAGKMVKKMGFWRAMWWRVWWWV